MYPDGNPTIQRSSPEEGQFTQEEERQYTHDIMKLYKPTGLNVNELR